MLIAGESGHVVAALQLNVDAVDHDPAVLVARITARLRADVLTAYLWSHALLEAMDCLMKHVRVTLADAGVAALELYLAW